MVEIWEGEEIWGDFYAKLLYEGKREGSKPRPSKESIARGSAALPPLPPESRLISGRCYPSFLTDYRQTEWLRRRRRRGPFGLPRLRLE